MMGKSGLIPASGPRLLKTRDEPYLYYSIINTNTNDVKKATEQLSSFYAMVWNDRMFASSGTLALQAKQRQ